MESGLKERFVARAAAAEQQVEKLAGAMDKIQNTVRNGGGDSEVDSKDLIEQDKLNYRIKILQRAVAAEEQKEVNFMKNIINMLRLYFTIATDKAFPELPDIPVQVTLATSTKFGDYQCNVAPSLSALLKSKGIATLNPRQVAEQIVKNFPPETGVVDRLEIAGPGFINIHLCVSFLQDEIKMVFLHGVTLPPLIKRKRVVIDFSSPNVAKEMHVGHLRSSIIGDSISRLLEYMGYDVLRINHVGDWGTQFGMLIAHLQDTFPNYLKDGKDLPVSDLQGFYKESKQRFDEDENFKSRAFSCVVRLQAHEPEFLRAWNLICDVSRKEFSKIYDRLEIKIIERGESFYQDRMESIVKELQERGFLIDDSTEVEGKLSGVRKIMFDEDCSGIPLTIVKSDGGFTYDTSDMATIKQRIEEEKAEWIIYITDSGQATHFNSIFRCAERAGILNRSRVRVDHIGFGVVLGEDRKKFKTRSGDTIKLVNLLDEGVKRAGDKLLEKGRENELSTEEFAAAQNAVAYGCIKYADLSHDRIREYVFSFDKMLDDKGNTAVYLLYAYTRIKSIARKAGVTDEQLKDFALKNRIIVAHEKEKKLVKKLLQFPEVVIRVTEDLHLHSLCELMYEIATTFTEFYDSCYCIEKDKTSGQVVKIHMDRLVLCEATAAVMKRSFDILGLKPVQKM